MTWQSKHDIILGWIDSCTKLQQLQSLIPFIKSQAFDTDELLLMVRLKSLRLYGGLMVDNLKQSIKILEG